MAQISFRKDIHIIANVALFCASFNDGGAERLRTFSVLFCSEFVGNKVTSILTTYKKRIA